HGVAAMRAERVDAVGKEGAEDGVARKSLDDAAIDLEGQRRAAVEFSAAEAVRRVGRQAIGLRHQAGSTLKSATCWRALPRPKSWTAKNAAAAWLAVPASTRARAGMKKTTASPKPATMRVRVPVP